MQPCRLIYKSIATPKVLKANNLRSMVNDASNYNRRQGLTGLLLLSNGCFLQVLEGIPSFVNETFTKIVKDDRHHTIELISYEEIVKSEFSEWGMKLVDMDLVDAQFKDFLVNKYPVEDDKFKFVNDSFLMLSLLIDLRTLA